MDFESYYRADGNRIDEITDCLIDTRTGEEVETEFRMRETLIRPKVYKGWKFNWSVTEKKGMIYMNFS